MELDPGTLSGRVAAFCRYLRDRGFRIGVAEAEDALRAIDAIGVTNRERLRAGLRSVLCGKRDELRIFDRVFDVFFGDGRLIERENARPQRTLSVRFRVKGTGSIPAGKRSSQNTAHPPGAARLR